MAVHSIEGLVDVIQAEVVGNKLIHHKFTPHVILHELGHAVAALEPTKCRPTPLTACNKLEGAGRDLLARCSHTDNGADAPALVAALKGSTHQVHIAHTLKRVVKSTISEINQHLLDGLVTVVLGVDEISGPEVACHLLLCGVDVDGKDAACPSLLGAHNHSQTHTADTEHGNVAAGLHPSSIECGAITGSDATAQQTHPIEGCLIVHLSNTDLCYHRVLAERGAPHEVEDRLPLAGETRSTVWHNTTALRHANFAAKVSLLAVAELAVVALGDIQRHNMVSNLHTCDTLTNTLDDPTPLMAKNAREHPLRI
eukprot:comp12630_c0_seq1/m.7676 comp12630_c0_seq1/g.7676  ORF comp12630_c0_seq1/g.7676 comp12630_c0_seq1/m.7676 type:complete len:312 (+) comp12630_c0_seq1:447-1382(+)